MPVKGPQPDLSARLRNMSTAITKGKKEAVKAAAEAAKKEQLARIRVDSGGDLVLSGVNRRRGRSGGAKLNVRYRVRDSAGTATAIVMAVGPLQIINNDTRGRVVRSSYVKNSRSGYRVKGTSNRGFVGPTLPGQFAGDRRAVLNIPGVGYRRSARHPGTKGKRTWQVGRKAAEPKIRTDMDKAILNTITGPFRGR